MSPIDRGVAAPVFSAIVGFGAIVTGVGLFRLSEATLAGLLAISIGLPSVFLVLFKKPHTIPYFLIVSIHLGLLGIKLPLGNINIRPNMLIAAASCFVLLARKAYRERRQVPYLKWLLLMSFLFDLATLLNRRSPFFSKGIADCILLLVNIAQYALVVWLLSSDKNLFDKTVRFLIYCSTAFSCAYLFVFACASLGLDLFQQLLVSFEGETGEFVRVGNLGTTQGSYISFTVTLLLITMLFVRRELRWSNWVIIGLLASNLGALALTFARGPWIGVVLSTVATGVLALMRLPIREFGNVFRTGITLLLLVIGGCLLVAESRTDIQQMLADRFLAFDALDRGTAAGRMLLWAQMLDDVRNAPLLGHGAHNYAKFRDDDPEHGISENFVIEMLHASGVGGGGLYIVITIFIMVQCALVFSTPRGINNVRLGLPLLAGFLSMYLASLTNPGMWGGYFWSVLGLLVAGQRFARSNSSPEKRSLLEQGR